MASCGIAQEVAGAGSDGDVEAGILVFELFEDDGLCADAIAGAVVEPSGGGLVAIGLLHGDGV